MNFWTLFSALAHRQPEVEAILAPGRSPLRFGDLPDRLDAVRRALNEAGIGRGDLVAVALRDRAETAVCLLGLISIAVAVPFNPDFTEDEVSRYFRRIRPKAVILPAGDGAAARRQAAIQGISIIDLAVDRTAPVGTFALRSEARGEPTMPGWGEAEDLACIFLTSGSTAAPKLVPLRQRALLAYVQPMGQAFRLGPSDRCVHTVPMFHASGLNSSLLLPLVAGCGVVCPEGFDVPSFFANIETFRPTWYNSNYTTQRAILDQIEPYRGIARQAGLRFIRSGSGRLDPKTQSGLEEAFQAPVLECFSMSEVGCVAYNPLPPDPRKPGAVGITLIRDVRIIDDRGTPLAPGQEGEVVVRGPSVFDGYWDDPDANAELFIDGWFRTGDTGRFDGDGYLTLTGRLKETINRGGEKIAPAEVERVLLDHAAVRDACVFAVPHPTLGEEIAAAIVPATGAQVAERDLMDHAKARLAGFKVPRRIFICAEFPKGGTGKVQRRQVAEMCLAAWSPAARSSRDAPPRKPSPLESEILTLWNNVIGIKSADIDQDFFLAGGDSLRAALLFARLRARFGVILHLRQVFDDAATVAGIARLIEQAKDARAVAPALPSAIVPIKTGGDLAPIFAVPGLWGTSVGFVNLARLLDRRQPVYGLDSRGLDGEAPVLDRMAGIAADNIRRLKTVQPDGPYHLMGALLRSGRRL